MTTTAVRLGRSFPLPPGVHGRALFDGVTGNSGKYRWYLHRDWNPRKPKLITIGMNPSSAGANQDDNTIRLLERFAIREDFGSLTMLNAYALVSTDRGALLADDDPVGPKNNQWIEMYLSNAVPYRDTVIACWGVIPRSRHDELIAMIKQHVLGCVSVDCFGKTSNGFPRHPLRTKLTPVPFL